LRQINEGAPRTAHSSGLVAGEIRMNSFDDWKQVVRRNKLLGMWAAEKLGKTGQDTEAYSNALAVGTLDPERSDVLSKIRKDFDAAGVVQSDEQIIQVMDDLMLQAGNLMPTGGGGPDSDAFALMLARQLKPE
jgi:hypothetical protein